MIDVFWKKDTRPDGRVFAESRRISIQHGILSAAGSALVKTSHGTVVLASVTLQVGQPAAAAPKQGDVVVTVSGSTNQQQQQQLQSFLQRVLEENVDLEQLVVVEGRVAYRLAVSVQVLDESGNVVDACVAAATTALLDTQLPVNPEVTTDGIVHFAETDEYKALLMPIVPCSLTAAGAFFSTESNSNARHHWIVDPNAEELAVQESCITVVVNAASAPTKNNNVLAVELSAEKPVSTIDLARMIHMATGHATDLYPILQRPKEV